MDDSPDKFCYRSLELLCRQQAKLSTTPDARHELECMALEYKRLADWQERQWPEGRVSQIDNDVARRS
jgi:hypothetical protein